MAASVEARQRAVLQAQAGAARLVGFKAPLSGEDMAPLVVEPLLNPL